VGAVLLFNKFFSEEKRKKKQDKNIMSASATQGSHQKDGNNSHAVL